jgi:hypothetical protein
LTLCFLPVPVGAGRAGRKWRLSRPFPELQRQFVVTIDRSISLYFPPQASVLFSIFPIK